MCIDQQPAWLLADPAGRTSPIIRDRGLFAAVRFNSAKHGCGAQVQGLQERTPLPGRRADNQWGHRLSPSRAWTGSAGTHRRIPRASWPRLGCCPRLTGSWMLGNRHAISPDPRHHHLRRPPGRHRLRVPQRRPDRRARVLGPIVSPPRHMRPLPRPPTQPPGRPGPRPQSRSSRPTPRVPFPPKQDQRGLGLPLPAAASLPPNRSTSASERRC
jgi:hypothetical protein